MQASWADMPHQQRASYFLKAANIIESRQKEFIDILVEESGSWVGKAGFESGYVPGIFRSAAACTYGPVGEILPSDHGKLSMVVRRPLGVITVISPWNFPLLLSSRGFAVAMAMGNTIVLKPSEETPISGGILIAEAFEEAGLPAGVLNVVTCSHDSVASVGDELISNDSVNGVSFTGSTAVGRDISAKCGSLLKKACLELGGKDALIVLDDADLELAVNAATFGSFMHQGQICMSVERVIVDEKIADEFIERFSNNAAKLQSGNPQDPSCAIGPIINQRQAKKIAAQIEDALAKGATISSGGTFDERFIEATIISDVNDDMTIYHEETFGPVAIVIRFSGDDEAVRIANDSRYGLSAGVITKDEKRGMEVATRLETGMAHINDSSLNDEPHVPFGGSKLSGLGRHGGSASVESFTETRWITIDRGQRHYPPPFLE
jgi:aldehyde dehydrogenase (NAD+)